ITLSDKSLTIAAGETKKLTATVTPDSATDKSITWTSSDNKVAT
ncbi:MAG: Ig-like domain-containing protein, partial [Ruminococcus sp.]|nr:Ig-like domain-containing protein [Ruminococcus sp.]